MSESIPALKLKPGREKAMLRKHPWIFSGAIESITGEIRQGETVEIVNSEGDFLAWAAYSPRSQIRARVWSWDRDVVIDADFFTERIKKAIDKRIGFSSGVTTDAYRLIFAESDELPGVIVDKYGDGIVLQCLTAGAEYWQELITRILIEYLKPRWIFERSDVEVRALEGLPKNVGRLYGETQPSRMVINEHGLQFYCDVTEGHKTGFYLDQRENRQIVRSLAERKEVLDCFSYSGGFTLNALLGGAVSVVAVDSSSVALEMAAQNLTLNGFSKEKVKLIEGDVFQVLRKFRDGQQEFDLIVLDPPKFAATSAQVQRAARGYKDINLLAFKLLRPGGFLVTFSCSGGVDTRLFQKIVADAALDAGVGAQIVAVMGQAEDHPVALNFPEGAYLKGLVCRLDI
jgi:23S rRNA (cytosine1962-C5)-methyltransferase